MIVSFKGPAWSTESTDKAALDLLAAIAFLPRQGASTRLAIGSQVKPNMFCSAEDAALSASDGPPPIISVRAAADCTPWRNSR